MHPCLSWLTLSMLTAAPTAAPAAGPAVGAAAAPAAPSADKAPVDPSAVTVDPEARAEQAAALYSQRKYAEAAVVLEDLWTSIHEPRDLFNAALARLAIGHRAQAIRYWEIYLQQPNIPADGREQALGRIKKPSSGCGADFSRSSSSRPAPRSSAPAVARSISTPAAGSSRSRPAATGAPSRS